MLTIVIIDNDSNIQIQMPVPPVIQVELIAKPVIQIDAHPSTTVNITTVGPQGPIGPVGPAGVGNPVSETRYVSFSQTTPSATWTFTHDLSNPRPDVNVYDINGEEVYGDIYYPDSHTVVIQFAFATTGMVQLG